MRCSAGCVWFHSGNRAFFIISGRALFIHPALTVKTKWASVTLAGPCSTVLLQYSTKDSESLCQFSTLWEWFFGMCINSRTAVGIYQCYHCTALSEMLCCRALTYEIQNQGQYLFEGLPNPPLCSTACSPASELGTLFHLWSHQRVYLEEGIFRITTFCCWIPSKERRRYGKSTVTRSLCSQHLWQEPTWDSCSSTQHPKCLDPGSARTSCPQLHPAPPAPNMLQPAQTHMAATSSDFEKILMETASFPWPSVTENWPWEGWTASPPSCHWKARCVLPLFLSLKKSCHCHQLQMPLKDLFAL